MKQSTRETAFEQYVRRRRPALLSTARALTAGDDFMAEDLVQGTLVRLYIAWPRIRPTQDPDAYARRVLVNALLDHRRRAFVRREQPTDIPPETAAPTGDDAIDSELLDALAQLPPRMRAAVVLRHVCDYSTDQVAETLGCSVGNVKSQTARGLTKLRELLPAPHPATAPTTLPSTTNPRR